MRKILAVALLLPFVLVACDDSPKQETKKNIQAEKAAAVANAITFTENAEIDNIKKRLELTSDPGLLGFIAIFNAVGQVSMYAPVEGKITSGGKRLTPPMQNHRIDRGSHMGSALGPAPSDEGTWGSSNPYIFFWTPDEQYFQSNMEYIYSDQPFRTRVEPLIDLGPQDDAAYIMEGSETAGSQ